MKKQLLLIIGVMISTVLYALPITKKQAEETAKSFLYSNNSAGRMFSTAGLTSFQLSEVELKAVDNAYYVYNIGENKGFVIVSGDDSAEPILGYSYEGSFDYENMPSNLKSWLDGYASQIKSIRDNGMQGPAVRKSASKVPFRVSIPALLTSKWNQDRPFNDKCPNYKDGNGNRPTGCVATAVSQVMYYHRWPKEATAEIPGYTYVDDAGLGGDGREKTLETLPAIKFDWDNMLDEYKRNSPKEKCEAVATLMRYVGQAVKMQYCVYASGAHSSDIAQALRTYMNYDKGVRFVDRTGYSDIEWADMIYNELASNRPVLYAGTAPGVGGHQFICDGYENDFFHFNWGWGGQSDGFFKLNALAPSQQGIGGAGNGMDFSERHHIVIGVQPPVEGSVQPEDTPVIGKLVLSSNFDGKFQKDELGTVTMNISSRFGYNGEKDGTFSVGLGLFDSENKFQSVLKETEIELSTGFPDSKNDVNVSVDFTKEQLAADGTYYMRAIVKSNSTGEWNVSENGDKIYFKIQVEGQNVTVVQYPFVDVVLSDIRFEGPTYQGAEAVLKATVKNVGDNLNGMLYLTHNNKIDQSVKEEISLKTDETKEVSLRFITRDSGELSFGLSVNGKIVAEEIKTVFEPGEMKNALLDFNVPVRNTVSEGDFLDITANIDNKSAENNYKGFIRAILYTRVGFKYTEEKSISVPVEVDKSSSAETNLHFDNLRLSETYYLAFAFYSNGRENIYGGTNHNGTPQKMFSKFSTADAISYYDETGAMSYKVLKEGDTFDVPENACFVIMPDTVKGRTINKSANPNCIYKLNKNVSLSEFDGYNVVKDDHSSIINLSDSRSYFSNAEFAADNVNVTIKVDDELSAIWLPFAPVKATANGVELKKGIYLSDMSESDYMLMPIVAEDDNTVYCDYEQGCKSAPCILFVNKKYVGNSIVFTGSDVNLNLNTDPVHGIYFNVYCSNRTSEYTEPVYGFTGNDFGSEIKKTAPFHVYLKALASSPEKIMVSYPEGFDPAGIEDVITDDNGRMYDVYNVSGVKVRTAAYGNDMLNGLPSGIYIVNGKKIVK